MNRSPIAANTVLSDDALRAAAPSIFADRPWDKMSDRYTFVPTSAVVAAMRENGLVPVAARQAASRIEGKGDYTRHMIRFRPQTVELRNVGDVFPEIVVTNSHDGSSSYEVSAGVFRLACLNGMVVSNGMIEARRSRHFGNIVGDVIDATFEVLDEMPKAMTQIEQWQSVNLDRQVQESFADAALMLRYEPDNVPTSVANMLSPRRTADTSNDLWTTFNRVQENLLRGVRGIRPNRNERRRFMLPVKSIAEDVRLNRALWTLAASLHDQVK